MSKDWKSTLWEIIYTILTIGISHIRKRKKRLKEKENEQEDKEGKKENPNESFES